MVDVFSLVTLWFALIAVLWAGYFVLEGFDFGVGMLLRVVGRDSTDRRAVIHTIGPFWDGNEVWLIVAGGATFAAFPEWYATLFSGFYLPLLLILIALILRGVAFEFRGKHDTERWRSTWDWVITFSSAVPSLLWGVAFANIVRGVPIDADGNYTGGFFNLLNPYALLGGVASLLLFAALGAAFLALKTRGELEVRSRRLTVLLVPAAGVVVIAFALATLGQSGGVSAGEAVATVVLVAAAALMAALVRTGRAAWVFAAGSAVSVALVAMLFVELFPNVMPSTTSESYTLTLANSSSTHYTLTVMTVVALVMMPIVLAYQAWAYWVFRHRIGRDDVSSPPKALDALSDVGARGGDGQTSAV